MTAPRQRLVRSPPLRAARRDPPRAPPASPARAALALGRALSCALILLLGSRAGAEHGPERLYVSNEREGTVAVLDPAGGVVVRTLRVGARPRGIKLSPDGKTLYVALSGSPPSPPGRGQVDAGTATSSSPGGTERAGARPGPRAQDGIGVVDLERGTLVRVLPAGSDPEAFDLSPDGATLYVSNEDGARLSILDLRRGRLVGSVPVGGEPEGVSVAPDGRTVWVTSELDALVTIIDTTSLLAIGTVRTALRPRAIAFDPTGARAWVTAEQGAALTLVDARRRRRLGQIALAAPEVAPSRPGPSASSRRGGPPPRPMGLILSADGRTLYVSNGRAGSVSVIDTRSGQVRRTLAEVGARPWGLALSRDGARLYTANGPGDDVSVIELPEGRVIRRIPVAGGPWGLARR